MSEKRIEEIRTESGVLRFIKVITLDQEISPPTGYPNRKAIVAASPCSVETSSRSSVPMIPVTHVNAGVALKLKSERAVLLPTKVLSEPQGLLLFQVVRGGIELGLGLRP